MCQAKIYQDFEVGNGSDEYAWPLSGASILLVGGSEPHLGARAIRVSGVEYNGIGVQSQIERWNYDMEPEQNDRLSFWIYALPLNRTENNVSVRFFDHGTYHSGGFEIWTTRTARYGQWTQLYVLFEQLPPDFDLHRIDKIELVNYWPGMYYFDSIAVERGDRAYQTFEPSLRAGSTAGDYGWKWNDADFVGFSGPGEPVHEGEHSWKLIAADHWSGTGLQSEEQQYFDGGQTFWHVNLRPEIHDRLTLWVYALPQNGLDNNVAVQFYDHDQHFTDETKAVVWTTHATHDGQWTRLTVLFSELPPTLNLHDLDKIQLQVYWPGTYYFDDIRAVGPIKEIDRALLPQGRVVWDSPPTTGTYVIYESLNGPDGPWSTYWSSADSADWVPDIPVTQLTPAWFRLNDSEPVEYQPPIITIDRDRLKAGVVEWKTIPQTDTYEVESAPANIGPWSRIHLGHVQTVLAEAGEWYRARAVHVQGNNVVESTAWGPPVSATPGFVHADRTDLREQDGTGPVVLLRGVNLGADLLIEKWMTGFGDNETPPIEDEYTLRQVLEDRFGVASTRQLLQTYQHAYLQDADFDILARMGMNTVRVPVYFRLFQDENGEWIRNGQGQIDFSAIDRLVKFCADRGLYVVLDLHGAPGSQSNEAHSGRANYNKLFEDSAQGQAYRDRTVEIWEELARHYRDDPAIAGYDLLNEPIGAPTPPTLWALYDRLYDAIRVIDTNHVIIMEGVWDWTTLPAPVSQGWENVVYQFHYYLFDHSEDLAAHQTFIDQQVTLAETKQREYQVPAMIGEFHGFSMKSIWEYYLTAFNRHDWSWTPWSYKFHNSPSDWGLYTHADDDEALPSFRNDPLADLARKLSKYDTANHHVPNRALIELQKNYLGQPLNHAPVLSRITNKTVSEGRSLSFRLKATDPDEDPIIFNATNLPSGALLTGDTFTWTPAYNQGGTYVVTFIASDGGLNDSQDVTITVNDRPLRITSMSDSPDPFSPNGDGLLDTTTFKARFNHKISSGKIVVTDAGDHRVWVAVDEGGTRTIQAVWDGTNDQGARVPDGTYAYLMAGIDGGDSVAKSSGTVVIGTPDLLISALTHTPASPASGAAVTITAIVKNRSNVRVADSTLQIQAGEETIPATYAIPALAANATRTIKRHVAFAVPHDYLVTATIDPAHQIAEKDDTNNQRTDIVTVH